MNQKLILIALFTQQPFHGNILMHNINNFLPILSFKPGHSLQRSNEKFQTNFSGIASLARISSTYLIYVIHVSSYYVIHIFVISFFVAHLCRAIVRSLEPARLHSDVPVQETCAPRSLLECRYAGGSAV